MALSFTGRKRVRKDFGGTASAASMPNLIEVQKSSYDGFLQMDVPSANLVGAPRFGRPMKSGRCGARRRTAPCLLNLARARQSL